MNTLYKYSSLLIDERKINVGLMTKTWSAHVLLKEFFCKQTTHSAQPLLFQNIISIHLLQNIPKFCISLIYFLHVASRHSVKRL